MLVEVHRQNLDWGGHKPRVLVLHVLNGASALDTTDCKARRVCEAAHHSRLPLQGALHRLVELGRVLEVDDVDVAVRRADDAEVVLDVEGVDALLAGDGRRGPLLAQIPVLDRLVPRSRDDHGAAPAVEEAHVADGLVVRANDNVLLRREIADLDVLVCACRDDLGAILFSNVSFQWRTTLFLIPYLGEVDVQDGLGVLVGVAPLALAVLGDFVDADLVVPTRHGEEVGPVDGR